MVLALFRVLRVVFGVCGFAFSGFWCLGFGALGC